MIQSAHAILLLNGHYVPQLRDKKPSIPAFGQWSLFGGRVDEHEAPAQTVSRDVQEELSIIPHRYSLLWSLRCYAEFERAVIRMWFFEAHVNDLWSAHQLKEGQAVEAFTYDQVTDLDIAPVMRDLLRCHYHARN